MNPEYSPNRTQGDPDVLFMISLDSYEVHTGAGKDLFFILMPLLNINLEKIGIGSKELCGKMNPGTFTIWRIPVTSNVAGRRNTVFEVILPRITSSSSRNPPEECLLRMWQFAVTLYKRLFFSESLPQERGIHRRNGYSAVNYLFKD
jgi:hypothetical protein